MMMEGGTNEDFNTVCTLLDCYNPYAKEDESYSDELPLWVFSGPLPSGERILFQAQCAQYCYRS